jgi:transcriptional regulator with XRE-family HTH domain
MLDPDTQRRPRGRAAPEFVDRYVGGRLRERRVMLGLTQQQLAARIGVTYQQAHKYEKGVNRLSAARLFDVANSLGVEVGFFFEGLERGRGRKCDARQRLLLELVRNFVALPTRRSQELVCALVRSLAEGNTAVAVDRALTVDTLGLDGRGRAAAPAVEAEPTAREPTTWELTRSAGEASRARGSE